MNTTLVLQTLQVEGYRIAVDILPRAGGGRGGGRSSSGGGGFSSGGSSGFSSSSSGFSGGTAAAGSVVGLVFGLICMVLFFIVIFAIIKGAKTKGQESSPGVVADYDPGAQAALAQALEDGTGPYAHPTRTQVEAGVGAIQAHDPAFNEADFLSDTNRAFFMIQQAWTERRPELSRQVMHDGVWQQHKFQIDQYISGNKQNVLENLAIQNSVVVSANSDESFDTIVVRFFASCADYDIDLADDKRKVIRGDRSISDWAEDWVFQRSSKAITKPNQSTLKQRCPNCGAPLNLDLAGVCQYCRAPVMSGEFDWVLTRIEQLPSYEVAQATIPR